VTRRVVIEADGGSRGNPGPAGYGAVVRDADTGEVLREVARGIGVASNNVAEYSGLIAGLEAARDLGADAVDVRMDSLLVVNQMSGLWKVKHEAMRPLASRAAVLVREFARVGFQHIPRAQNSHADRLANEAMDAAAAGREWTARAEVPEPEPEPAERSHRAAPTAGWGAPRGPATPMLLLRHGETPLSVEKRFSGSGEPELTERGQAQARAAAEVVAGWDVGVVVCSPRARARQTAEAVAEVTGLDVVVDDDVAETDFGAWEGHTFAEIAKQWPEEMSDWLASPDVAPPGGESFSATFTRVRAARDRLVSAYAGKTVLVVAHVTPIKAMLRDALDAPPHALYRIHLDPASLSAVDWYAGGAGVVRLVNATSHLGPDLRTPPAR
jgi:ribonuclease H / adenosylcobalamin/alpha-ribazole phosphatase